MDAETKTRVTIHDSIKSEHWTHKKSTISLFEERDEILFKINNFEKSVKMLSASLKAEKEELDRLKSDLNIILDKIIEQIS